MYCVKKLGRNKQIFINSLRQFLSDNRSFLCWLLVLAVLGIVLGAVFTATNEYLLEERECEIALGKAFFRIFLLLFTLYVCVLFSGSNAFLGVLGIMTVFVLGVAFGFYFAVLFGACGFLGILNFFFVYLPLFLLSLFFLALALSFVFPQRVCVCSRAVFCELTKRVGAVVLVNLLVLVILVFVVGSLFGVIVI